MSCFGGLETWQCGDCSPCKKRRQAFKDAGLPDNTQYVDYKNSKFVDKKA